MENKGVVVYMESTPNPAAMKFMTNVLLLPHGDKEYMEKSNAIESPLAYQLFDFTGVTGVFISGSFVTVIKEDAIDWFEIQGIIREFIRSYLVAGEPVFNEQALKTSENVKSNGSSSLTESPNVLVASETEQKIVALLDEYVKPAVEQDGGAIDFKSFDEGIVKVKLRGSCSGCPSSVVTLKSGIERLLKQMIPEVQEVIAED